MRTTVRLDGPLLDQAKREAARRQETVTSLIEQGLRLVLAQSRPPRKRPPMVLPVSPAGGGLLPGVNLDSNSQLIEIMEGRR